MRACQINQLFASLNVDNLNQQLNNPNQQVKNRHLVRALFIIIDLTQSMKMKDFKPSRLSVCLQMAKTLIKKAKDMTPIIKFSIAVVSQQKCRPLSQLNQKIDQIRVQSQPGFFSLENSLSMAMDLFKKLPNYFNKQIFMIQSSPSTKDQHDIFQTLQLFQKTSISINIASLVGQTFIFKKLSQKCNGKYETVSTIEQFELFITEASKPPLYNPRNTNFQLIKLSFSDKKIADSSIKCYCFCCFKKLKQYHICGKCKAILCKKPPMECPICMTVLVFPQDLFRHHLLQQSL